MPTRTTTATPRTAAASPRSPLVGWLAVVAVMMGIFSIVTTEILPIGLLTSVGSSFAISDGTAGLMMTLPGFLAALSAPLVTVATARIDRRLMLCAFALLLVLANFLAATAPNYWLMLLSRVMVGISIGGFWSIGAGLAERLVSAQSVTKATAVIFAAVPLPPVQATRLSALRNMLGNINTRFALLMTFLIVMAHFGTYTYVTPFLEQITQVSPARITMFLLLYGAAGIVGNFVGGATVRLHPRTTFGIAAALIAGATLLLPVLGRWEPGAIALLIVWGSAYGAVPVASQTWFSKASPRAPEAASVLFTASFQVTISIGALVGGAVLDRTSLATVMTLGGATAILMAVTAGIHFTQRRTWPESA
ncbi:MFS transporter [Streptomyces sp. ISL-98]|uniref:MFS transporter n=1 Tax=Streptomyces sp. ISL-98 TaxID=2819192 RepID=UPI001BECCA4F|nr:MFS transporter [Streptomyces sp. ISL-98]MBT2506881.1 MFS transporter [Streptomyces sp. ISL-98]